MTHLRKLLTARRLWLGAFLLILIAPPLLLAARPAVTENIDHNLDRSAVESIIEDYFRDNPLKLAEFLEHMNDALEAEKLRDQTAMLKKNNDAIYNNPRDFTIGRKDAPITIVEYFDYNCGYCKRVLPTVMKLIETNSDLRFVFKEFPILGDASRQAAQWAMAIETQANYVAFHRAVMEHRGRINETALRAIAKKLKLNADALAKAAKSDAINAHLNATYTQANALGLRGTPAFIINGEVYAGALDAKGFDRALAKAREDLGKK